MQQELPMKDIAPKRKPAPPDKAVKSKTQAVKPAEERRPRTAVAVRQSTVPSQPKSMLAIIADAAANPAVNPEAMRALLDMQKEIVAEERKQTFDAAFIALQAELPVINKDGKIEIRAKDASGERSGKLQQATPYATFDSIMDAIQPLLTKNGFGLSFETQSANERLLVRGHLIGHGHERHTEFPLSAETSGSKNNAQGWGSSLSYGKRYCTIALLNIRSRAMQDADTDGFPGDFKRAKGGGLAEAPKKAKTLSVDEAIELREFMDACTVPVPKFCQHFGIAKVADLPRELLQAARKECVDYRDRREAAKRHG